MSRINNPYLAMGNLNRFPSQMPFDPLTMAYLQQDQMARSEGEERYLDTLSGRQGLRGRTLTDLGNYGDSFIADVKERSQVNLNNSLGDLASRGLSGSSLRSAVTNASERERNSELARVNDAIINRRTNADERLSENIYGQMERRTDSMPNAATLAQLSQGLGQAGFNAGGIPNIQNRPNYNMPQWQLKGPGSFPQFSGAMGMGQSGQMGFGAPGMPQNPYLGPQFVTKGYAPPQQVGGLDDPYSSAAARYGQRQSMMNPYAQMGFGMGFGGNVFPGSSLNAMPGPNQTGGPQFVTKGGPQVDPSVQRERDLNDQYYEFRKMVSNAKVNRINPGYGGFGHNTIKEQPFSMAPAMGNISFGNPAAQNNQALGGMMQTAPRYSQMPTGYPLGQPSVGQNAPTAAQQQQLLRAAAGAWAPMGGLNPYMMAMR